MTTHDLHNEGALMRVRSAGDGIDSLDNTMQSRIRTNGHIRATEIVIDGAHLRSYIHLIILYSIYPVIPFVTYQADNVQHIVLLLLLAGNGIALKKLFQQTGPFLTEQIGTSQRTVSTNNHQIGNAMLYQIIGGLEPTSTLTEVLATSGSNDGTSTVYNRRYRCPTSLLNAIATIDHTLVAFTNKVDLFAAINLRTFQ